MATKAGQRISDINELGTLQESDLARIGTDIYRRDLAKEQETAKTINPADKDAFNRAVYNPTPLETPKTTPTEPQIIDKGALIENVQSTFDKYTGEAGANRAFIEGAYKASGKVATEEDIARGGTLSDVIERVGIGGQLKGFGTTPVVPPADTTAGTQPVAEQPKSAQEKIVDLLGGIGTKRAEVTKQAREDVGLNEKSDAITTAETLVNDLRTELANQQIFDFKELEDLKGKPLLRSTIAIRSAELSQDQKLDLMITQNDYNNALVGQNIAQGNYTRAQEIVQQTADDFLENTQFQLQALEAQGQIDEQQRISLENQALFERDLTKDGGFVPITPEQASTMREADTWEDPVTGKFYRRPVDPTATLTYEDQLANVKSELEIEKLMKEITGVGDFQLDPKDRMEAELKIGNHFDSIAKENMTSVRNIGIIETGWTELQKAVKAGESLNAPSQAMLVTFQKMLDPTSVVRESEYGRSADGSSLYNRIKGAFDKLSQGGAGVTEGDLKTFYTMSKELQKGYQGSLIDMARRSRTQAENYNLNLENILTPNVLSMLEGADYTTPEDVIGGVVDTNDDWNW